MLFYLFLSFLSISDFVFARILILFFICRLLLILIFLLLVLLCRSHNFQSGQVPIYHGGKRTLEPLEISKRPLTPSAGFDLDHVLSFIDSSYVTLWLERAQQNLAMLREWYKDTENVLLFSHFWLSEMPNKDRRDLVELEGDVLLDEFRMALQTGFDGGSVNDEDLISLRRAVFSEYPDIFFSDAGMGCLDLLHILGTDPIHWVQTTEQGTVLNHPYHELLGSVKCTTVNAELRQWLLSLRGFCLVSMLNAIIGFFKNFSVMQVAEGLPRPGTSAGSRHIHQAVNHDSVPQTPSSFSSSTLPGKNHDDSDKQDVRESADLLSKRLKAAVVLGDIRPQIPLCINPKKPLAPIPSSISQVGKNLQASSTQSSQRPARDVLNGCLSSKIASSSLSTCRPSTAGGTRMYIGAVDEAFDAVKLGHTDVLYYYLSRNLVSLSSVDGLGRSLLFLAALHKHEQVVQFLLENKHGIDLNV